MILTVDLGNTHISFSLFDNKQIVLNFRKTTTNLTSDEIGNFVISILNINKYDYKNIKKVTCSSVVPSLNYSLKRAFEKYFGLDIIFAKYDNCPIIVKTENPNQVGADLLASALGGVRQFSGKNLIIIDLGTITTITAVSKDYHFLGACFIPGVSIQMKSMATNASKLPYVEIQKPGEFYGQNTVDCINAGIYYGHLGALKMISSNMSKDIFNNDCIILGTGGFSLLFKDSQIFNSLSFNLIHYGLVELA